MKYIGQKKGLFDSSYYGSGRIIKNYFKKYGKQRFKLKPVDIAFSQAELNELEIAWIKDLNCVWPNGYNLAKGGYSGPPNPAEAGRKGALTGAGGRAAKKKGVGIFSKDGREKTLAGSRKLMLEKRGLWGLNNKRFAGHTHSVATLNKMSKAHAKFTGKLNNQYGTMWISSHTLKKSKMLRPVNAQLVVPDGWVKGRFYSNGGSK